MSFNKRYITKDLILSNINDLDRLLNADALITDMWSSRFIDDLNPKEREIRKELYEKYKFSSGLNFTDPLFNELQSMSECLISLFLNPDWGDITKVSDKLGHDSDFVGEFDLQRQDSINRIIEYYNRPTRNEKIEDILSNNS